MTKQELIILTFRRLNAQRAAKESRISREDLYILVPQAMDVFCDIASQTPALRGQLQFEFEVEAVDGAIDLTTTANKSIHRGSLRFSQLYNDSDDPNKCKPYIFKEQLHLLDGELDQEFGYYALGGTSLMLRTPATGEDSESTINGNFSLVAIRIPFIDDSHELPDNGELIQVASDALAGEYLKFFPTK